MNLLGRIGAHQNGVGDLDDRVGRQAGPLGVLADLLRARGLVDADGADDPSPSSVT